MMAGFRAQYGRLWLMLDSTIIPMTTLEATVVAELPQQLYHLKTDDGSLVANLSEETKRLGVKFRTGQCVLVRRASLDPGRGIIVSAVPAK